MYTPFRTVLGSICALVLASFAHAQITIVPRASGPDEIGVRATYGQDFNTLPNATPGTAETWEDNRTLPGWYAATGGVASASVPLTTIITGSTEPADTDVLMTQLFTLRDRLRDAGAEVALHLVPHGEHSYGLYDTTRIAKSAPPGYVIDERPRLFGFLDEHLKNAAPTLSSPGQPNSPVPKTVAAPKTQAAVANTQGLPAVEAAISSSAPAEDIDEAAQGYLAVKHSAALSASRKAYFQFTVTPHPTGSPAPAPARFTVAVAANFRQRVQLWALDQAAPDFSAAATWKNAPANDPVSNGLLRSGARTAVPLGEPLLLPAAAGAPLAFDVPDWARLIRDDKITLVLTGVEDAANNKGGLRLLPASARLQLPVAVPAP